MDIQRSDLLLVLLIGCIAMTINGMQLAILCIVLSIGYSAVCALHVIKGIIEKYTGSRELKAKADEHEARIAELESRLSVLSNNMRVRS